MSINQDELKQQIDMICLERGLEAEEVMDAIEKAIAGAYRKEMGEKEKEYKAEFDFNTGKYSLYEITQIVDEVEDEDKQINIINARLYNPDAKLGELIKKEILIDNEVAFGRIASQVARQVLFQSINSTRHTKILQKYKDRVGDVVSVEVDYFKKGGYVVKLGQTNGFINRDNLLPGSLDRFKAGQIVKALIVGIDEDAKGNSKITLSRTHPDFVKAIIRNEVPEVDSDLVHIDKIVREPGNRTKILVSSNEEDNIDPVGAILGRKNTRITNITREINSQMREKLDIIEYNPEDLELMIMDALEPAEIEKVEIDEENKVATVYCYEEEARLAVGRGGVNIKLASRLLDYELNVKTIEGQKPESSDVPEIIS
jgi:transcription termination/antitermination protein NusA